MDGIATSESERVVRGSALRTVLLNYFNVEYLNDIPVGNAFIVKLYNESKLALWQKINIDLAFGNVQWDVGDCSRPLTRLDVNFLGRVQEMWHFIPDVLERDHLFSSNWSLARLLGHNNVEAFIEALEQP